LGILTCLLLEIFSLHREGRNTVALNRIQSVHTARRYRRSGGGIFAWSVWTYANPGFFLSKSKDFLFSDNYFSCHSIVE
jgi:hypothetical protein